MRDAYPRRCFVLAGLILVAAVPFSRAAETDFAYPPTISLDQVRQWVDKASKDHPRLLATKNDLETIRRTLDGDPLRRALADAVVQEANAMLDLAPITRTKQGRRLLGQSRRCVKRTVTLAMAYYLTGDTKYANRGAQEMLAVAQFSDWNPSHFLDVAEMTFALAIGYDWLYDQLDDTSRKTIRAAIIQKGVVLPLETRHKGWVKARNNWGQVCHGGLTAGALAVLEDAPDLTARTVHNAVHNVTYSMAAYAPRGSYPEGPGYWAYGTSYNVLLIGVLESALGTDFGLTQAPGFSATGQYPALACGPSGLFFNYADGGATRSPQPVLYWFASRFSRPDWLLGEPQLLRARVARIQPRDASGGGNRLLPLALLWMTKAKDNVKIQMPLSWSSAGETPITLHRSSWTDPNATYVGLKGGSPSANHGHMDTGSFVLDADRVRWAIDLGAEGYYGIEARGMNLWNRAQDSDRWTIFRQSNDGHNTLVIDGQLQRAAGHGEITRFSSDPAFAHTVVDLSSVYAGQAESVQRGIALLPSREVLIQDELTGLKPGSHVRWGMITPGVPDSLERPQLELRSGNARLQLTRIAPKSTKWQTIDTAKPRNEWDSPNRGTRMVAFEAVAPDSGILTFAVLATPGTSTDSVRESLNIQPLASWGR
jgi:hypothetical protein